MDEYDKKFAEMQKYIPFLEAMIERLQNVKDKSREVQLQKMQSLHGILSNSKRKLKIETLQRCEDVLQKLHNKVEKGNTPGLHFPHKKNEGSSAQSSNGSEDGEQSKAVVKSQQVEDAMDEKDVHETPASPSPPVSPDTASQIAPIIIPTERSVDFVDDSKPASPDPVETLPTKAPIIIPTERTSNDLPVSPGSQRSLSKSMEDVSFSEWDMLEENENQARNKNWQPVVNSGHDVTAAIKLVGNNLSQKLNDGRPLAPMSIHSSRHIPTVTVPALGNSRRLTSMIEKNRLIGPNLDGVPSDARSESPVNVPDVRLKSPDPDILFPKPKNTSPRLKDAIPRPMSKPPAPLLLSPPPVSEPPLSMEDLAELLSEEGDDKSEGSEKSSDETKPKKDKQDKDPKSSKSSLLMHEDMDIENERRWEEVDKHIVKLTSRKCLPTGGPVVLGAKGESSKPCETKGPPVSVVHSPGMFPTNAEKTVDNRSRPPSPGSKIEPRYADNYERHPRNPQPRDGHGHDNAKDKSNLIHCRPPDEDLSNPIPVHPCGPGMPDERNALMYQRRQSNVPEIPPRIETQEFRMEGTEYFNRQVPNQAPLWPPMHPPVGANDFCATQWPPATNFPGIPVSTPQPYQLPMGMHQELWNVAPVREPLLMEPHPISEASRLNQFPNTGIRPLMSPNARPQDLNHIPRPDEMPNVDVPNVQTIQPLISPTRFPVGPPCRNFQPEGRPYEQPFDRGLEYPLQRQSWDAQAPRPNEVPYRPENEVPCGVIGPADAAARQYSRPSTPCPWNRDRDRGGGRGRSPYYNERNRVEVRNTFNRDARRPEWPRDNHNEWDAANRFVRDNRNISDRDPRVRPEHAPANQTSPQSRDNNVSARDPRLARDKHLSPKGKDLFNDRDPRKRSTGGSTFPPSFRKAKEKTKSPPKPDGHRRSDPDKQVDKLTKEKMQSPLESLYGVIDTKAKAAQGYCLQKFKIPKIKRNESSESPTSSHSPDEAKTTEPVDKQEAKKSGKDDATAEVSSSSDGNPPLEEEDWNEGGGIVSENKIINIPDFTKDEDPFGDVIEEKIEEPTVTEPDIISTSAKSSLNDEKKEETEPEGSKPKEEAEPEGSKPKEEVTQEWIEALIRKSFEFGEGKKFVEQAKFMQKLGEVLQAKKLKKIKKIIESESESSNSDKEDTVESKKVRTRKKRRVIVSDSSDDESLAERLGILNTGSKQSLEHSSTDDKEAPKVNKSDEEPTPNNESSELNIPKADVSEQVSTEPPNEVASTVQDESKSKDPAPEETEPAVADAQEESRNEEPAEDKESGRKTPKAKAKRRNSLEMLQEDIREMFISDDVVTATGYRQCRTQKENQQTVAPSTPTQSTPPAKKDSDTEETTTPSTKSKKSTKPRPSDEPSKKTKSKKEAQRVTRQRLKQFTPPGSDSEEDQPLALRTELIQSSSAAVNQDTSNEERDILRRSKRIINKETIREPRVMIEKTDISKLDCLKVMFDSSSDESFGIDVSELAAAVDISLHPDKQPEPETPEPTEKRKPGPLRKTKKKTIGESNESKVDELVLSDGESIVSDISMTSSVASSKKVAIHAPKAEISNNEELLSNILVGLTPSKTDPDKDALITDKGSDADVDDDASDQLPTETNVRKSLGKKKKKKCNWQMGILSKKKKKKTPASISSKDDSDATNVSLETGTAVSEGKTDDESNSLLNTSQSITDTDSVKDVETSDKVSSEQKKSGSHTKSNKDSVKASPTATQIKNSDPVSTPISSSESSKNVKNKGKVVKSFYDVNINQLIDYAWTGQERYKCLLCFFTGKNIVHHYKLSHVGREILISRLNVTDARLAIQEAKTKSENATLKPLTDETCIFNCRICSFITEGAMKVAVEAFYEHCTTHTGEYRFRCNSCNYQAVAKSSMRTHYYKVCRKFKGTFNEAITEDEIPDEDCVYGYLCSSCNYIQLKRSNLEDHIELWHKDDSKNEIIKVDMSLNSVRQEPLNVLTDGTVKLETSQEGPENLDESANDNVTSVKQNDDVVTKTEDVKKVETCNTEDKKVKDVKSESQKKEDHVEAQSESNEKKKTAQLDGDSNLPTGNLSVFVCPPELEKTEVEIQLERKRKMQEILQNIGIKLQKDTYKKGLSIIDKLKDKMKTSVVSGNENDANETPNSSSKVTTTSTRCQNNDPPSSTTVASSENTETALPSTQEASNDKQCEISVSKSLSSSANCDSQSTSELDPSEAKIRDPLATLDRKKNDESDAEMSDSENVRNSAPVYESDSSSEQSDTDPLADVNMILKETSTINACSKDPMLTTIQRLAAQLQATKPIDSSADENSVKSAETTEKTPRAGSIPKPPEVVPISSIKRFVGKMENKFHEIVPENLDDSNPPKNFIRLRRLSGDMLSVLAQPSDGQEDAVPTKSNESNAPAKVGSGLTTSGEEECSFLRIENVVSLAPTADNVNESPIINDIRKAVETSPMKGKGVSVLKKSHSPLILKRLNAVTITQPLSKTMQTIQSSAPEMVKLIPVKSISPSPVSVTATQIATNFIPIAPKSKIPFPLTGKTTVMTPVTTRTVTVSGSSSSNLNYKIVKVVRAPNVLKSKDPVTPPTAIKLKSMDAYNAMLKPTKLTHLYKCMGRDCSFTTDTLEQYRQHYYQHVASNDKSKQPPFDYQKCAYCYMALKDWNQMKLHIEDKHAHCRYQCSYCFYRAITLAYVQIHQAISHPGLHDILLGKLLKEVPTKEEINRHDYIHPYICQHDCGKFFYVPETFIGHIKSKHGQPHSSVKCHVCRSSFVKSDQLLAHYKLHAFYKYQCLYCLNGTDNLLDMHTHLSSFHCNRLPQALERSLPPQAQRNKDVIDQLILRTLDDSWKISEEVDVKVINDGKDVKDLVVCGNVDAARKTHYSKMPKDLNMLDKDENEALNKSLSSLFGSNSNSNNSPVGTSSAQNENTSADKNRDEIATSKSFKGDSDISMRSILDKEITDNDLLDNSVEPLELPAGAFDCSDEFININLLDNPDFLMNVNSRSSNVSLISNVTENDSKAEDSDIEIVDIINSETIATKDVKNLFDTKRKDSLDTKKKDSFDMKTETKVDTSGQETVKKEKSASSAKQSKESTVIKETSSSTTTKNERPLTLDDIKHTGFTGTKLYRCGYEYCNYGAPTAVLLRSHTRDCPMGSDNKHLNCVHCHKRFVKIGFLLEHLKVHGLKRFGCALCKVRRTVGYQAMAHMKTKHKVASSKLVPADPKNPSVDGLFIVQPVVSYQSGERKGKKRKSTKSVEKESEKAPVDVEKVSFNPDEIEFLPRQAIYNRVVQCAMCPYTTKVRTNIIRHLLLHAKDESVPESGPVNPVPCLDKKERMFDKMVNLASSSHQNGRMGGKHKETTKNNDDQFIPKFVPEHKRYVCGVAECNYLTVDEAMLRCHLKALHSEELYFRCPHCPQPPPGQEGLNIAIDKMAVHLKMHDTRLYKCSHCNHHHYHRHIVERHLTDKHPEKRPFVKVIRELENTENNQATQEEIDEELPDPDGNHWKCNICEHKCVYKAEMVTHAATSHEEKCQYKCTLCSFKSSGKIMFEQHINNKHSNDTNVDFILVYQRIKGVNKKSGDNIEQSGQEEPFDTTPLWRRDMPRIRHIRGILLEEEDETSTESTLKTTKRKSDVEPVVKPAKIKPGKSGSLDDAKQTKEKYKRSLSCDKVAVESEISCETSNTTDKAKETKVKAIEDNDLSDSDVGRFGPYGKPDGNMYVCTLCVQFKSKYKHDMRDHLYRELNYARWHCKDCGYLSVNRNTLLKHFTKHHNGERPNHEPLSPDDDIENWVGTLLSRQTRIIKGLPATENTSNTDTPATATAISNNSKTSASKTYPNSIKKASKTSSLVNKSSTLKDNKMQDVDIDVDTLDDSSKDNEGLIMDMDEIPLKQEKTENTTESDKAESKEGREKPTMLVCKHCNLTFTRWRGFKLHVLLTHLKRLGYICPYCDRSTNSEALIRQHIRSKHPGCPEKLVPNPSVSGPELTDQFWEREYGIVFPKRSKKRKRRLSEDNTDNDNHEQTEKGKCTFCGFIAMNLAGLKGHMRVHRQKPTLKCSSCSYSTLKKSELYKHWETEHPFLSFKTDDTAPLDSSGDSGTTQFDKKNLVDDDYSDDIEEEQVSDAKDDQLILRCFYCSFRSSTLEAVQNHWSTVHKEPKLPGDGSKMKSNCPFRYKEMRSPDDTAAKAQCSKTEVETPYELYLQQSHSEMQSIDALGIKQEGWICQWCNELCDSEVKMKNHHSMFHSHLPLNFKKQEKSKVPKGYVCPECLFATTFINVMKNHVSRHINLFKCKYCEKTFGSPTQVSSHNAEKHPNMELKIESIHNYEALMENIMAKVKWQKLDQIPTERKGIFDTQRIHAVAKKSTTKSVVCPSPIPVKIKAVARKSTNPYSRYLSQTKVSDKQESPTSKQFSYYGTPKTNVNLGKLNTYMVVGGHRMKVNCTTLARLINIEPKIILKDLKYNIEYIAKVKKTK
ncbi:uncharacterized protein LOC143343263 isoform X3 [Colletes latitarsis]|uniref:uncharacterized protein LOC143343263 isoform X3 n=1 Tax=Colletes latitarsis TaxID=2605962 RepID=UPI004036E983